MTPDRPAGRGARTVDAAVERTRGVDFEKWHGLGNDFVLVRRGALATGDEKERFVAWCDRRRGIGADGVLIISSEDDQRFTMRVVNRDGSTPEICGNGIRCAVRSWAHHHGRQEGSVTVLTGAGPKSCRFDRAGQVSVDMGPARFDGDNLPPRMEPGQKGPTRITVVVAGEERVGLAVSMGNPHLVIFAEHWDPIAQAEASRLEHWPGFPDRTNVSFANEPRGGRIGLRVWERGAGFTQACGSAACATAVAAVATGRAAPNAPVPIALPGGELSIRISTDLQRVEMTGPATFVYRGRISA